jgi:hypothetical protein
MTKVLNIIETPYRATVEEQDDTVLWLTNMLKRSGLDLAVLLRASAVNYCVRGQDATGLRIGGVELHHPSQLDHDIEALLELGVPVHFVREDAEERGIPETKLVDGAKPVGRREVPAMLEQYDQVWHW